MTSSCATTKFRRELVPAPNLVCERALVGALRLGFDVAEEIDEEGGDGVEGLAGQSGSPFANGQQISGKLKGQAVIDLGQAELPRQ